MKRSASSPAARGKNKNRFVECPQCEVTVRSDHLSRHLNTHQPFVTCQNCSKSVREDKMEGHLILCQDGVDERICNRQHVELIPVCGASSINGFFRSFELSIDNPEDYDDVLDDTCTESEYILEQLLKDQPLKSQIILTISFIHHDHEGEISYTEATFRSSCEPLLLGDDIKQYLGRVRSKLRLLIENFERMGSGWIYNSLISAKLEVAKFKPLTAGGNVVIPEKLKNIRSLLNITSNDNRCFLYCLLAKKCILDDKEAEDRAKAEGMENIIPKKYPDNHTHRYTKYLQFEDELDMEGIDYPIKLKDIAIIEQRNNLSISIFEWDVEEKCVIPLRHDSGQGRTVELLYLEDDGNSHFLLIKNFNAFMRHRTKHHNSKFFCMKCLYGYMTKEKLKEHIEYCNQRVYQIPKMPEPGFIKFESFYKEVRKLFTIYCDFECLTLPVQGCERNPNPNEGKQEGEKKVKESFTEAKQIHSPCSFSIVSRSEFSQYEPVTIVVSNEDPNYVTQVFMDELRRIYTDMMVCYDTNSFPIDMTPEDEKKFKNSFKCHICKKKMNWQSKKNPPVRDHDHIKEKKNFRGAAHSRCNLNYWERTKKVPVLFHNLKYDLNLFLLDLIKFCDKIDVIPENMEKFKAVFADNFIFVDSCQFLSASLENLVDNLKKKDKSYFKRLRKEFPDKYELLMEKGVYFYDYASDFDVFSETQLPPKASFYNELNEEGISDEDYARALKVFEEMECQTLLEYMELYVLTDSILLCDVFESFRDLCLDYYKLDPCHYMSLPGFGMDAMLKMTAVQIEKITDPEMYFFIEKNLRGGITTINHRYFKANNRYLLDYNPNLPTTFLMYLDINNLYGLGLQSPLPIKQFKWLSEKQISRIDFMKWDPDGDRCFILEVDLEYPSEIHDLHNCYPLAVESKFILTEDLSPYNLQFLKQHNEKHTSAKKLVPDLNDKEKFVCSLKNLQFYINHGLKLKKIHRVLTANQEPFMKCFIDFNSNKRMEAKSKFEQDFFKLMNNSCYGKLIEDVRKRRNVTVVKSEIRAKRLISKPQVSEFQILDENATLVQSVKRVVMLDKPIACGFMVLETAKNHMAWFWHDVLKPKYGNKIKLILSDTDSFIYATYTEDAYKDLIGDDLRDLMDLSVYPKDSPLHDPVNKKVVGKMSDEKPGEVISEVVALKPKMYSILSQCHYYTPWAGDLMSVAKTAKGIPKTAKRRISHQDFKDILKSHSTSSTTFRSIRSIHHQNQTLLFKKRALSSFDDKKYILNNGVNTLSYGHYRIPR